MPMNPKFLYKPLASRFLIMIWGVAKMSKRAEYLKESPCYQCGMAKECLAKIARCKSLQEIADYMLPRADVDYHECSLWKVLMMEKKNRYNE